jgi:hypothetical protein
MVAVEGNAPERPAVTRKQRRRTTRADVERYIHAVRDSDQQVVDDTVIRLSRARPWLAPLVLAIGAFAMLFDGVKLLFTNWRLTLIQVLPAMWIWAAMLDLKVHLLHDQAVRDFASPQLALLVLACVAITAACFYLNAVFAYAIVRPGAPEIGSAFTQPRSHLAVVLGSGAVTGLLLGVSAFIVFRWGGLFWFTVSMGIVIWVLMICYVAVPSRLIGIKTIRSRRDKLTATVVGGAIGGVICTPPYLLGRIGILLLGSKWLFIPGVILLIIGGTLEAGTVGAVRTVKMSAKLVSGRDRADDKVPSGDNVRPDETGLPLLGRRRGARRWLWSDCPQNRHERS